MVKLRLELIIAITYMYIHYCMYLYNRYMYRVVAAYIINSELWLNFPSSTRIHVHVGQCVQSTYPEDFVAACLVVQRKWAFNPNSSRCEGISYSPCGQEREGHNVFDTEAECNRTCVRAEGK